MAEKIGISRQTLAKWESGESTPDILFGNKLAEIYDVSLDDLVNESENQMDGQGMPPRGKYIFGTVTVGERGQIVIPAKARKVFQIQPGDDLLVLGDIQQGLCKSYPGFALKDVSFALKEGRITGFVGRNGAGKSTTLNSLFHFVHPQKGEILFWGKNVTQHELKIKQKVGFVSSGVNYYPNKKLKKITEVTRAFYREWDEDAYRYYMNLFQLEENKTPKQLSAGMKVKYAIVLALSHGAELLILDEPTSGLDPVSREELMEIFRNLRNQGKTLLFSTHITSDLEKCADDIVYIKNGKILAEMEMKDFLKHYQEKGKSLDDIMVYLEREVEA